MTGPLDMSSSHQFSAAPSATHHTAGTAGDLTPHADASAQALRSCRGCSAALLTPTQPGIRDTSAIGRIGALDSPNPAGGPVTRLTHQHHLGGPIRVQHDIQPGAISTGVTATVALRLDADRPDRVEAMRQGRRCFLQTGRIGMSGRWLWVGGMDAADLADHNQRPDGPPREIRDEYESLHGPTSIERHARKKHRRDATPTDAA